MSGDSTLTDDQVWMTAALREAAQAETEHEVPVGAVVVRNGTIIGRGRNSPISRNDPTAHAEIQAVREAAQHLGNYRLVGATVYVTVEPCLMCMGALLHARIKRLVFGCSDPKAGAAGSLYDVSRDPRLNHQIEVIAEVGAEESRALLQQFFRKKRDQSQVKAKD